MRAIYTASVFIFCLLASTLLFVSASLSQASPFEITTTFLPLINRERPHKIAFLSWNIYNKMDLYVIEDNGSRPQNLTNNPARINYSWSPDGTRFAFSADWNGYDIYTLSADGSDLQQLTYEPGIDRSPTWSPDGNRIAFSSDRDGSKEIYSMAADGSDVVRLTDLSVDAYSPVWSPDGSRIAFGIHSTSDDYEVYVMNMDGTNLVQLTDNTFYDVFAGWSPDGTKLLILSDRDHDTPAGNFDIYVIDIISLNTLRLTATGYIEAAAWSPLGDKIAFSGNYQPDGLFIMNPDGADKTPIRCLSNPVVPFDIAWSTDGKKIAYTPKSGVIGDTMGIYVIYLDGTRCLHLTTQLDTNPQWKPGD